MNKYLIIGIFVGIISHDITSSLLEKDSIITANKINWFEQPKSVQYCESFKSKFRYEQWTVFLNVYNRAENISNKIKMTGLIWDFKKLVRHAG